MPTFQLDLGQAGSLEQDARVRRYLDGSNLNSEQYTWQRQPNPERATLQADDLDQAQAYLKVIRRTYPQARFLEQ